MFNGILEYFRYDHLPEKLQVVSKPFCDLAYKIDEICGDGSEKTMAFRKLLESKDCAVRAALSYNKEDRTRRYKEDKRDVYVILEKKIDFKDLKTGDRFRMEEDGRSVIGRNGEEIFKAVSDAKDGIIETFE